MALEIVRRFVNGAWKTEAAEAGGGGSLPDTAGKAQANVLSLDESLAPQWTPPSLPAAKVHGISTASDTGVQFLDIAAAFLTVDYDSGGYIVGGDAAQFVSPQDGLYQLAVTLLASFSADPGTVGFQIDIKTAFSSPDDDIRALAGVELDLDGTSFVSYGSAAGPLRLPAGATAAVYAAVYCENAVDISISQLSRQSFSIYRIGDMPPDFE